MDKFRLQKQKEWVLGPQNSLRNKIIKDTFKFFLIYFLVFELLLAAYFFITEQSVERVFTIIQTNLLAGIITFIIIALSFRKTLRKHINKRFEEIQDDMRTIKKGNFSKRLKLGTYDEFDEMVFFANSVLDEFEKKLNFEKKYALMDPLTLTYNRRALNLSFEKFSSRAKREKNFEVSMLLFDLDYFKKVNDTYGHDIGDKVLRKLCKVVKQTLRKDDNLYRVGGEEFLILFFKLPKKKEEEIFKRIKKEISYTIKKKIPEIKQEITISGGFVRSKQYDLNEDGIFESMYKDADELLYEAKQKGRNKILS